MARVRRRMKLVEAVQFDGTEGGCLRAEALCGSALAVATAHSATLATPRCRLPVMRGDWLIRDPVSGDLAVVTNEQFFRDHDHPTRSEA